MDIDEAQGMVPVLLHARFVSNATRELIKEMWFFAHYKLKLDEKKTLRIEHLWIFSQHERPGEKNIFEPNEEEIMKLSADKDK